MKKFIIFFAVIFMVLIFSSVSLVAYTFYQVKQPLDIRTTQLFTIKDGTSFSQFSKQLIKEGWLKNRFWLRNYVRIKPEYAIIKAGTYQIEKYSFTSDGNGTDVGDLYTGRHAAAGQQV